MDFLILDINFRTVGVIDSFVSAIWTDRFDEAGDFEIKIALPMNPAISEFIREGNYLVNANSDRAMIIEDLDMTTDVEGGDRLLVTGRSLERLLDRRIILNKTTFEATYDDANNATLPNLQNGIKKILDENVINPAIAARRIPGFVFEASTDPEITKLTFEAQYYGDNIYDVITTLCKEKKIGFKVTLNNSNQFVFKLLASTKRTYDQLDNPYIVFSSANDNLFNSSYYKSNRAMKNVAVVAGEVEGVEGENGDVDIRTVITIGSEIGIDRREIFVDAKDVSINSGTDESLTDDQYRAQIKKRGIDALIEHLDIEAFEGEVEATRMYRYGEDFFIGDIVQLEDKYGHEEEARVSEFIISQDSSGIAMYPTFTIVQEGEYDVTNVETIETENTEKSEIIDAVIEALPQYNASNCKTYEITIAKNSGWVLLTTLDSTVVEHINDARLTVSLVNMSGYVYEWYSCSMAIASNTPIGNQNANNVPVYGMANRQHSETSQGSAAIYYPPNNTMTSDQLGGSFGMFRIDGNNYYFMPGDGFIRAGTYRLTFAW